MIVIKTINYSTVQVRYYDALSDVLSPSTLELNEYNSHYININNNITFTQ